MLEKAAAMLEIDIERPLSVILRALSSPEGLDLYGCTDLLLADLSLFEGKVVTARIYSGGGSIDVISVLKPLKKECNCGDPSHSYITYVLTSCQ